MTHPDEDLQATEGVDEGSAASTVEGSTAEEAGTAEGSSPPAVPPADPPAAPHAPDDAESRPAPPDEVDTAESRAARAAGSGQELAAGEG